jgi:hypothetical protein
MPLLPIGDIASVLEAARYGMGFGRGMSNFPLRTLLAPKVAVETRASAGMKRKMGPLPATLGTLADAST